MPLQQVENYANRCLSPHAVSVRGYERSDTDFKTLCIQSVGNLFDPHPDALRPLDFIKALTQLPRLYAVLVVTGQCAKRIADTRIVYFNLCCMRCFCVLNTAPCVL